MHPYISQAVAAEQARDRQQRAAAARRARQARRGKPGTTASTPPETYAEFLSRTSGPLLREPAAARRSHGQTVG
jgi:hypothetical protein